MCISHTLQYKKIGRSIALIFLNLETQVWSCSLCSVHHFFSFIRTFKTEPLIVNIVVIKLYSIGISHLWLFMSSWIVSIIISSVRSLQLLLMATPALCKMSASFGWSPKKGNSMMGTAWWTASWALSRPPWETKTFTFLCAVKWIQKLT